MCWCWPWNLGKEENGEERVRGRWWLWDLEEEQQDVALGLLLACMKGGRRGQKGYFVCTSQVCCGPHDYVHMAQPERVSGKFANSCGPQMAIWRSF